MKRKLDGMEEKTEKKLEVIIKEVEDKEVIKFYINDEPKEIKNDIRVGMIDKSIEVENLQNNTTEILEKKEQLWKEEIVKEIFISKQNKRNK